MNSLRISVSAFVITAGLALGFTSAARAAGDSASLADVHKTLQQAAGYQAATPPTVDEQTKLLNEALKMIQDIPHVYRGHLKVATRDIDAALSELGSGDTAHKARKYIFDADDEIKSIM